LADLEMEMEMEMEASAGSRALGHAGFKAP
jgi:hypothetical protein